MHQVPDSLEVASDESDYEESEEAQAKAVKSGKVTAALVEEWRTALETTPGQSIILKAGLYTVLYNLILFSAPIRKKCFFSPKISAPFPLLPS